LRLGNLWYSYRIPTDQSSKSFWLDFLEGFFPGKHIHQQGDRFDLLELLRWVSMQGISFDVNLPFIALYLKKIEGMRISWSCAISISK